MVFKQDAGTTDWWRLTPDAFDTYTNGTWTNQGAIYDPVSDSWQTVQPPVGWGSIGDAQNVVLSNGTLMLADAL